MSSSAYFAEIRPDALLRGVVLVSGAGLALSGVFLILLLPVHGGWRALLCLGWAWQCLAELRAFRAGFRRCRALRLFADGRVLVETRDGWRSAALLHGSVLLEGAGWLHVQLERGPRWAELVRAGSNRATDWRRLQVLWRHIGGTP
ncbi:MAG TPA: hypothetical protein VIS31_11570 [Woeseiaceae bacterium]